jgi:hypothetical protein
MNATAAIHATDVAPDRTRDSARDIAALDIDTLVIAGWTGRNAEAVEHHIRELEAIGVPRPKRVPLFYRAAAANLSCAPRIEVVGAGSSGEVEFVLVSAPSGLWVGVGSDHTDRELEKQSVPLSKQVCAKPIAAALWPYASVAAHWDRLELRSWAWIGGERRVYQSGSVSAIRRPADLIRGFCGSEQLPVGTAMFCGTLPVQAQVEFAGRFEFELADPVLDRVLRHAYDVVALPVVG